MNIIKKAVAGLVVAGTLLVGGSAQAYTVQQGDTLGKIADKQDMELQEVVELNPQINDVNLIYVGDEITTEGKSQNTVQAEAVSEPAPKATGAVNVSANDKALMASLVSAEARGESYAGKVAVAEVVLNRVNSASFPNTVTSVIYQSGQFTPVTTGAINTSADAQSIKAVNEAVSSNSSIVGDAVFFYNPSTATSRWLDTKQTVTSVGSHVFKK